MHNFCSFYSFFALSAETDTTFWEDVWNYLYDVYLRVDGNYTNIGLDKMPLFSIRMLVLGLFVGAVIACVAQAYHKQVLGGAVRRLIERGCLSPDTAQNAKELGYEKNYLIRNALVRSSALRSTVKCVEEENFYKEQREAKQAYDKKRAEEKEGKKLPKFKEQVYVGDAMEDRFYIPEELRIRAEIRFEKKGSGWGSTVISIVILLVVFFAVLLLLPFLLQFVDNFLGKF